MAVFLFASQWYAYDAAHGFADPFIFYVGWSCYLWGVLTPLAVCLAWRRPIGSGIWMRAIAFHLAISVLLTTVQLSIEAWIAVLRADGSWPLIAAVRHYLTQHVQVGLMTYWLVLGATHFHRIYDEARTRQLRAARLEARLAELQILNLRAQLHPHFLFNTLQAAATLIHEDPGGAEDILLRLTCYAFLWTRCARKKYGSRGKLNFSSTTSPFSSDVLETGFDLNCRLTRT